jgi:hypothetical protein
VLTTSVDLFTAGYDPQWARVCNREGTEANSMWQDVKPRDEDALGPTRLAAGHSASGEVSAKRSSALSLARRDREFRHQILDSGVLAEVDSDLNLFKQRVDPLAFRRAPLIL